MQSPSLAVEIWAQLPIGHARFYGDCTGVGVQGDDLIQPLQRQKLIPAVANAIEAVAGAEHFKLVLLPDKVLQVFKEVAVVTRSVPYVTLPAQFLSFFPCAQASNGESNRVLSAAEQSFRKVLLSIEGRGR